MTTLVLVVAAVAGIDILEGCCTAASATLGCFGRWGAGAGAFIGFICSFDIAGAAGIAVAPEGDCDCVLASAGVRSSRSCASSRSGGGGGGGVGGGGGGRVVGPSWPGAIICGFFFFRGLLL